MKLNPDEKTFLAAAYDAELKNEKKSLRRLRVELGTELSSEFDIERIRERYMYSGRLALTTIFLLDRNAPIIEITDKVAYGIQQALIENPDLDSFQANELADSLKLEERNVCLALENLAQLRMAQSGQSKKDQPGWIQLNVGSVRSFEAFLNYPGIEELLLKSVERLECSIHLNTDSTSDYKAAEDTITYVSNTAFILMSMDPTNPQLEDVANCFKNVCLLFEIHADRADDIEHSGLITELILRKIRESEILIADLSGERPNVYYEVGYAHALGKRPILYRAQGTRLHFDLASYNVPEYKNITELHDMFKNRLEAITNRRPRNM